MRLHPLPVQTSPTFLSERHHRLIHLVALVAGFVCQLSSPALCQQGSREWISIDGRRMSAEFVRIQNESLVVRKDGKEVVIVFTRLAPESIQLAQKLASPQGQTDREKGPPVKRTIHLTSGTVKIDLWGEAKRSVVFFNHSGPMKESIDRNMAAYQEILESGWSIVTWNYPKEGGFNEVATTIQKWVQGGTPSLLLKGYTRALVKELSSQAGIEEFVLVGNSLGAGVVMSDVCDLSACCVLLISPTEMFMPPRDALKAVKSVTVVGHTVNDRFLRSKELYEWIQGHHAPMDLWKDLPNEHLILGENLSHQRFAKLLLAILDAE